MKLNLILAAAAAIVLTASCGILGAGTTSGEAAAPSVQTGTSAGTALAGLYRQYKADGKVDLTNINNIVNLAALATNAKGLKSQDAKSALVADFVTGLIAGSNNLVNQKNSTGVIDNLQTISGLNLSSVTNAATAIAASTAASPVSAANTASNNVAASTQNLTAAATNAINQINQTSSQVTTAVSALGSIFSLFK